MIKKNYVGLADHIRVIQNFPTMLVRFTLHTTDKKLSCLVTKKRLTTLLLLLDNGKFELATYGHYNTRKQFIVEKFMIRNPDSFVREYITKPLRTIA